MIALAVALPLVPFAAALVGLLLPMRARRTAAVVGVSAAGVALIAAVLLAVGVRRQPALAAVEIVRFGDVAVSAGVQVALPQALVAIAVAAVATAVQLYSVGYLHDDERFAPYAAQVSLFTAAMLTVVVSSDLVQLLVGWEVMGICSYLLIGHDRKLREAPRAAVKAFLVTRVGDVGFWLGIVLLGLHAGSFRIADILARGDASTIALLLLLAGVAGKSAQFPLHTWLPDAMAGPTPISALIHAATMVVAGVYVVFRLFPLFATNPTALAVLGVMASVTMLLGALAACGQDDIKRVLAWSTVSQIAYMVGGLAVVAPSAALFHLLTHAAFKALLFLVAGIIIHAVGTNLMSAMGGLRRTMPAAFWTMTIGLGALIGVPPLAGFWSKESILGAALETARGNGPVTPAGATLGTPWVGWLVLLCGMATIVVTGFYATRLWIRTFWSMPRGFAEYRELPHPTPATMRWPVYVLAVPSALLGFAALTPLRAPETDGIVGAPTPAEWALGFVPPPVHLTTTVAALLLAAAGAYGAYRWAERDPAMVLTRAFYLDDVQDALVVRPVAALARLVRRGDEKLVDGAVEGTGRGALGLGRLLTRAHAAGLPEFVTAVLAGVVVISAAIVLLEVLP